MKTTNSKYPWNDIPPGGSFFVPALNVKEVRREGLIAAMYADVLQVEGTAGIYDGLYGVIFRRLDKPRVPV